MKSKIFTLAEKYGKRVGLDLPYFVKNGFWTFLRLTINTAFALILYIAFTRLVSQKIFGQYQFILSIFTVVYIFSHPGLNTALLRSTSRGFDGDYQPAVRKSFLYSLFGIPAILILGVFYYFSNERVLGFSLMLSSVFFPFFYAPNTWEWFLQGKHKFDVLAKYSIIQAFINTAATIAVIFFEKDSLFWIVFIYLISYTFFNVFYYFLSLKYIENNKTENDFYDYGWFLTKINIWVIISGNVDKILIGILLGPIDLAIYIIMTFFVTRAQGVLKTFSAMFFPKMANLKISLTELLQRQKKQILIGSAVLIVGTVFYCLAIPRINEIIFTNQYAQYSYISQIFSITLLLSMPISILGYYINAKKNEFAIILTNPVFNAIRIILNVYFILNFKLLGAAIAFNLSMLLWLIFHLYGIIRQEKRALQS